MNKRQLKKLDKKLYIAIKELNDSIAKEEGFPPVTHEQILETLEKVKKSRKAIHRTLKDYKKYVLKAK